MDFKRRMRTFSHRLFSINHVNKSAEWPFKGGSVLDISEVCNCVCTFCDKRIKFLNSKRKARTWGIDRFREALPRLIKEQQITFAGGLGEPLLNKDFPEMVKELKKADNNIRIQVLTNGLTLTPELCKKIINYVDSFRFSINAATEETHNRIIKNSDFRKIKTNLEYLKIIKPKSLETVISFIGMKDNIEEFPQLVEWACSLYIDEVILQSLSERGLDSIKGQSLVRHPDLLCQKWVEAQEVAKLNGGVKLSVKDAYKSIIEGKQATVEEVNRTGTSQLRDSTTNQENVPNKKQTRDCIAPFYSAIIGFDGQISPCCSRTIKPEDVLKNKFGNLFDKNPLPVRQTKTFVNLRKALLTGKLPYYCIYCHRAPLIKIKDLQRKIRRQYIILLMSGPFKNYLIDFLPLSVKDIIRNWMYK